MNKDKLLKSMNDELEDLKDLLKSRLAKAKMPIGTIRNWGGRNYKKISNEGKYNWELMDLFERHYIGDKDIKNKKKIKEKKTDFSYEDFVDKFLENWDKDKVEDYSNKWKNKFPGKEKVIDKIVDIAGDLSNFVSEYQSGEGEHSEKEIDRYHKNAENKLNKLQNKLHKSSY